MWDPGPSGLAILPQNLGGIGEMFSVCRRARNTHNFGWNRVAIGRIESNHL